MTVCEVLRLLQLMVDDLSDLELYFAFNPLIFARFCKGRCTASRDDRFSMRYRLRRDVKGVLSALWPDKVPWGKWCFSHVNGMGSVVET